MEVLEGQASGLSRRSPCPPARTKLGDARVSDPAGAGRGPASPPSAPTKWRPMRGRSGRSAEVQRQRPLPNGRPSPPRVSRRDGAGTAHAPRRTAGRRGERWGRPWLPALAVLVGRKEGAGPGSVRGEGGGGLQAFAPGGSAEATPPPGPCGGTPGPAGAAGRGAAGGGYPETRLEPAGGFPCSPSWREARRRSWRGQGCAGLCLVSVARGSLLFPVWSWKNQK